MSDLDLFTEVWAVDFEYQQPDGERPTPQCMVAREYRSGRVIRLWRDEMLALRAAPFDCSESSLFVAYNASAELGCFEVLGWPFPLRVLDLYVELRNLYSGLQPTNGYGLLACLSYHGLDGLEVTEKEAMRALAMRGGEYTPEEAEDLLDYCQTDVDALVRLLPKMLPKIDLVTAVYRGRYMGAVARMQNSGIPIDLDYLGLLKDKWDSIKGELIRRVDAKYGVYEGTTFKVDRFERWLIENEIPWPRLDTGVLDLKVETFREMGKTYPSVTMLCTLREDVSQLRLTSLKVGTDGRNRVSLFPFGSKTGRNQPSTTQFVFGLSAWQRGLIKPAEGRAVAYVDWSQQEFGIAAAYSGDEAMKAAYHSGDPYLEFAKQSKMAPPDATKATHKKERDLCKACILGVQYGMEAHSLARRIGQPPCVARDLLRLHRETYPVFWRWSDCVERTAILEGVLKTPFGWRTVVGSESNPRSLRNFPMQAGGAEMMRLACCLVSERGIQLCAPIHDALMIEAPLEEIDEAVARCQSSMIEASRVLLDGFELRSDAEIVRYPDRYADERGMEMWKEVWCLVNG